MSKKQNASNATAVYAAVAVVIVLLLIGFNLGSAPQPATAPTGDVAATEPTAVTEPAAEAPATGSSMHLRRR